MKNFVNHFVLATWWLGPVGAVVALWRRGSSVADLACGIVAGAAAGLVGSATCACLVPGIDLLPRWLWHQLAAGLGSEGAAGALGVWTPFWIVLAATSWAALGALVGLLLAHIGRTGAQLLAVISELLTWMFGICRLKRAAAFFASQ